MLQVNINIHLIISVDLIQLEILWKWVGDGLEIIGYGSAIVVVLMIPFPR